MINQQLKTIYMSQEKRINVFNKETGMLMRTTVNSAVTFKEEGYTHTSKSKLKSFLNKQAKLQRNEITLNRLGFNINTHSDKLRYFKMPSGKIHAEIPIRKDKYIVGRKNIIVRFAE